MWKNIKLKLVQKLTTVRSKPSQTLSGIYRIYPVNAKPIFILKTLLFPWNYMKFGILVNLCNFTEFFATKIK